MQISSNLKTPAIRLRELVGLVYSGHGLGMWGYTLNDRKLHFCSTLYEKELAFLFQQGGCYDYAFDVAKGYNAPFVMSDASGLIWLGEHSAIDADPTPDKPTLLVLIGPAFYPNVPSSHISVFVNRMVEQDKISLLESERYRQALRNVPVVTPQTILTYARMLHFDITTATLAATDVHYQFNHIAQAVEKSTSEGENWMDYDRIHQQEELLLQCVREGNLNYRSVMDSLNYSLLGMNIYQDSRQNALGWLFSCAAQCSHAAIEGGVAPKTAIALRQDYLRRADKLKTAPEIFSLTLQMLDEYIRQVYRCRQQADLTIHIQECCDYIRAHITEDLSIQTIAAQIGYTEYYLARKFHKEMGIRLLDYIKNTRIEYAKVCMLSTEKSIQEISDMLQFSTRQHFTRVFREIVGVSPSEFRAMQINSTV